MPKSIFDQMTTTINKSFLRQVFEQMPRFVVDQVSLEADPSSNIMDTEIATKFRSFVEQYIRDYYMERDMIAITRTAPDKMGYFGNDEILVEIKRIHKTKGSTMFCSVVDVCDLLSGKGHVLKDTDINKERGSIPIIGSTADIVEKIYVRIQGELNENGAVVVTIHGMTKLYEEEFHAKQRLIVFYEYKDASESPTAADDEDWEVQKLNSLKLTLRPWNQLFTANANIRECKRTFTTIMDMYKRGFYLEDISAADDSYNCVFQKRDI